MKQAFVAFPVTFFGMVLGLGGLSAGWRAVAGLYDAPAVVGQTLALAAVAVFLVGMLAYAGHWLVAGEDALKVWHDPGLGLSTALVPMATMIAGLSAAPLSPIAGHVLFWAGVGLLALLLAVRMGPIWQGPLALRTITPVLFLAPVGGAFIAAMGATAMGNREIGELFFGVGMMSWASLESILLNRLFKGELPAHQRATLGIYYAPPANACLAYLALSDGPPGLFATMMFGYALYLSAVFVRLLPWLLRQPFSLNYWAYSFGLSSLPLAALHFVERGQTGIVAHLALPLFAISNCLIGAMLIATLRRFVSGNLLLIPPPLPGQ